MINIYQQPECASHFLWFQNTSLQKILHLLNQNGAATYCVGGAVRDSLKNFYTSTDANHNTTHQDIDLASSLRPEETIEILKKHHIYYKPIGIEHGTIKIIIDDQCFEITTLRNDIQTDGRHAIIQFTNSWYEDAARRDFTVNAMYLTPAGDIIDFFNGVLDIQTRFIRFIGNPDQRIQEDYLRILRFFRFQALHGGDFLHTHSLLACVRHKNNIASLSKERITHEVFRLLSAAYPDDVILMMHELGFWKIILSDSQDADHFIELNNKIRQKAEELPLQDSLHHIIFLLRLYALIPKEFTKDILLCLTKVQKQQLHFIHHNLKVQINLKNYIFFDLAQQGDIDLIYVYAIIWNIYYPAQSDITMDELKARIDNWKEHPFPLRGEDFVNLGINGQQIGVYQKILKQWWIDKECISNKQDCQEYLQKLLRNQKLN